MKGKIEIDSQSVQMHITSAPALLQFLFPFRSKIVIENNDFMRFGDNCSIAFET